MIGRAVIIGAGEELLTGAAIDTRSAHIAGRLHGAGITVAAVLKVGGERAGFLWALRQARNLGELVIGTGGLGPEGLTARLVGEFTGRKLVPAVDAQGGAALADDSRQLLVPEGATLVPNPLGTAPGFRVPLVRNRTLIWLSGVRTEMAAMLEADVMPWIAEQQGSAGEFLTATFKICGPGESEIDALIKNIQLGDGERLSRHARYPELTLRLTVRGGREQESRFTALREEIRGALGSFLYAEEDIALEQVVGRLLLEKGQTLALAESCTGGLISHRITRVAGSSAYYYGGAVTYANEAKVNFLGVSPETLARHGAVSESAAREMSLGIRNRTGAAIGLAVTGIAGPSGGSPGKPVGTVWFSIAGDGRHEAKHRRFYGHREEIILGASQAALDWLRLFLLG